jgi:sugar lactone lactonase YvrE
MITDIPAILRYVPETNQLWIGGVQNSDTSQYVVDLSQADPKPEKRTLKPPIYAANGMRYGNGRVWVTAAGGNDTLEGGPYHPGLYSFDPKTGKSKIEANNYYGWFINSANDLDIDSNGMVWFTDPCTSNSRP